MIPIRFPQLVNYEVEELIYESKRTLIYRGKRKKDEEPVILKLMKNEYPSFNELVQFRNQYAIAKNLDIEGIVHPYDIERYKNRYVLILEDFGGVSLSEFEGLSRVTGYSIPQFLHIAIQLSEILHQLHQNRVIHKDIKPANILINPHNQQVKLTDFSISSLLPKETPTIQTPNALEGTLAYISPEQTGRINRGIDYRSDFYSLGVTFYELLTGQVPFESDDPMELVHAHLAKMPQFPMGDRASTETLEIPVAIPEVLTGIVMKLMAKNAEDRYQSALGLKYDLEKCKEQWQKTRTIEPFELGEQDRSDRFLIPEKLYGRDREVQILLNAFEQVSEGRSELLLVAGYSGVGKTAVVNEVHKPIVKQRGYFIKGKFDQFNRNVPFSAFVQAFRDLMGQLLSENDVQLQIWKTKILEAIGENAQVIIELIPELERIIGHQPPAPELSGTAAQNRFNLLFQRFIQVFTTPEHPLVIFVDDLQWADSASLKLIQVLMSESKADCLLLLGAYRDNEVFAAHPLMLTLNGMKKAEATIHTITLQPLSFTSLNHLVADTLHAGEGVVEPLTELMMQKTQGNPFFSIQFLKTLYQDRLITFDPDAGHWQCDIVQVRDVALTDDVVEFMALQLQKLPESTQEILKLAACIGAEFDLETLAIVSQQSQVEVATALWKALQEGLILPITTTYKFFQGADTEPLSQVINVPYNFLHDRVQQAAYSLIPDDQKQKTHLKIGQLLSSAMNPTVKEDNFFEIITHLNKGSDLIDSKTEREELAKLNLEAAQKAKSATAYIAAIEYANKGIELLALNRWQQHYEITLFLYNLAAETTCLVGDFKQMQQMVDRVVKNARNLLDKVKAYEVKILAEVAQSQQPKAIATALGVLELFGIVFPEHPTATDISQILKQTQYLFQEKDLADLLALPEMSDLQAIAKMQILAAVTAAVYQAVPELLPFIVCKQVELSLQYGNTAVSTQAFAWYGVILCSTGEIDLGDRIGEIAMGLLSCSQTQEFKASTINMVYPFVKPWKHHIQDSLVPLLDGYHSGLEMGTLEYAAYCAYNYCSLSYFLGKNLATLEPEIELYNQALSKLKQEVAHNYLKIFHQSVANLLMPNESPWEIKGVIYDEKIMVSLHQKANDLYAMGTLYINKLILSYFFNEWDSAIEAAALSKQYLSGVSGCFMVPLFHFYDSLTHLATLSKTEDRDKDLQKVVDNQSKLKKWSYHAPVNYLHKFHLVEAERYRVLGQMYEAMDCYDRAIAGAKENKYIQEEALANELFAKFYLDWGKEKYAALHIQEAYYCYAQWGAKAKIDDLEQRYPQLLNPILEPQEGLLATSSLRTMTRGTLLKTTTGTGEILDLATLMKASRTLSKNIELEGAIANLMQIARENAGAQTITLMLFKEEVLTLMAKVTGDEQPIVNSLPVKTNNAVPLKIINQVKHSQESILVENATQERAWAGDPYIQKHQPKSILCLPLVDRGKLIGILYLENNQAIGAFTHDRVEMLNLLCSQAAIALENAQLYRQAQQTLTDLQQAQLQLVQNEKMATLGNLVAGVAHEINNPLGFIGGNVDAAQGHLQDLLAILSLYQENTSPPEAIAKEIEDLDPEFIAEDFPKLIESMQLGCDRIRNISISLRTFSRTDTDKKTAFNLHDGIDSTLLILKYRLKATEKRPAIKIVKNYGDLPEIKCYAGQLNQVFMNLLSNALDALEENTENKTFQKIKKDLSCIAVTTKLSENKQNAIVQIADNGTGMPEEVKARIFEQGFTTKGVGKGTGLGLAIARQIVEEKHGGHIACHSQLGKGTEFIISLPFV